MLLFNAIAAMSENRVIGNKGKIPWHIPEDFRWFKHKTMGGTLIMGRKTFESIGKPLPGRATIVLTHDKTPIPGAEIRSDISSFREEQIRDHLVFRSEQFWICGGAQIYTQLLPLCMHLYLTRVKRTVEGDTFFPEFESTYKFESAIHETAEYRVERWLNLYQGWRTYSASEDWPFLG